MWVREVSFTSPTVAGNDTVITGLPSAPLAMIVTATLATADGFAVDQGFSFGCATGSGAGAQRVCGVNADDNVATTDTSRRYASGIVSIPNTAGSAVLWEATVVSFDSNGVTIDWPTVQGTGIIVNCLIIGGAGVQAEVIEFTRTAAAGTGNQSVATSFQGNAAIFFAYNRTDAVPLTASISRISIGCAASSSTRWAMGTRAADAINMTSTMDAEKTQRTDSCILGWSSTATVHRADFVSFDATPQFTINWIVAPGNDLRIACLVLNVPHVAVGAFNKSTGAQPATQDVSGLGLTPDGVLLASFGEAATTSVMPDSSLSVGGGGGVTEGSSWFQEQDAILNTEANCNVSNDKALVIADGAGTVLAECDLFRILNGFRTIWTINDAIADEICYLAIGGDHVPPPRQQPTFSYARSR